jgi:hypothetical protein
MPAPSALPPVFHEGSLVAMLPTEMSSDTDVVAAMFGDDQHRGGADG